MIAVITLGFRNLPIEHHENDTSSLNPLSGATQDGSIRHPPGCLVESQMDGFYILACLKAQMKQIPSRGADSLRYGSRFWSLIFETLISNTRWDFTNPGGKFRSDTSQKVNKTVQIKQGAPCLMPCLDKYWTVGVHLQSKAAVILTSDHLNQSVDQSLSYLVRHSVNVVCLLPIRGTSCGLSSLPPTPSAPSGL